jgi:hypothetical protein
MNVPTKMPTPSPEVVYPGNTVYLPELPGIILVCVVAAILISLAWSSSRRRRQK